MGTVIRFPTPPRALDPLLQLMKRAGGPITRQRYIELATDADTVEWTAEHDANLPPELRDDR